MMQKHTGGVKGTIQARGECPYCHRSMAGGYSDRVKKHLWLRPHNTRPYGGVPCKGGGMIVPVDHELMMAYSKERRERERRR